jgi:hypothetical protein
MIRHQFRFPQPNLDVCFKDRLGIAGNAIKAVSDGANLHAIELRVDGPVRAYQRYSS